MSNQVDSKRAGHLGQWGSVEAGQEFGQMGQLRDSLDQLRRSDQNNADMLGCN